MMGYTKQMFLPLMAGFLVSVLVGCGSSRSSRYYLLSSLSSNSRAEVTSDLSVGIGPIELPEYLDRPQIVTRRNSNRLTLGEFDRWAEPVDKNFARVLGENLSVILSTDAIIQYPWRRSAIIDRQVIVTVTRFDATLGGEAMLHARWRIVDADGQTVVGPHSSRIVEHCATEDYEAMVRAASRTLEELSAEIATGIRNIE